MLPKKIVLGHVVRQNKILVFSLIMMMLAVSLSGCRVTKPSDKKDNVLKRDTDISVNKESYFLKNNRGTYIYTEITYPTGQESMPLIFMAHGFSGTIKSGGADALATRFAKRGMAAIKIDFNPYTKDSLDSEQTNEYPFSNMRADAVSSIKEAMRRYPIDETRLGVYGRSYGGRLAMTLANESEGGLDFKALGLVAPAGDDICFERFMGGTERYNAMKEEARSKKGYSEKLGVKVTEQWFTDVETYNPCETATQFGDKPVFLVYNTLDDVIYPDTSKRCAAAYKNATLLEVTTEDKHGHEMGFKESEIKDLIMDRFERFFAMHLTR